MAHVVVIGCGATGSHVVPLLARNAGVLRLTLVDPQSYDEERNLRSQNILRAELGKAKAVVAAKRALAVRKDLIVSTYQCAVETLPAGLLRADAVLACVDNLATRQYINQTAWRLDVPWIDSGVRTDAWLARTNVYCPGEGAPCLECNWDERHYRDLEWAYPCTAGDGAERAEPAPAALSALAASMQVLECFRLLAGSRDAGGRQVLVEAGQQRHYVTRATRNPRCRFDHRTWPARQLDLSPARLTLERALALVQGGDPSLRVPGNPFVRFLTCESCGRRQEALRLRGAVLNGSGHGAACCGWCGGRLVVSGWDIAEALSAANTTRVQRSHSLRSLGLRPGEVFAVSAGNREQYFEFRKERAA